MTKLFTFHISLVFVGNKKVTLHNESDEKPHLEELCLHFVVSFSACVAEKLAFQNDTF